MKAFIYTVCKKLYNKTICGRHLLPWKVWSFVYDHCHRSVADPWG